MKDLSFSLCKDTIPPERIIYTYLYMSNTSFFYTFLCK